MKIQDAELTRLRAENQALREEVERLKMEMDEWKRSANEYSACLQPLCMNVLYKPCEPVSHSWPGSKHVDAINEAVSFLLNKITTLTTRCERAERIVALVRRRYERAADTTGSPTDQSADIGCFDAQIRHLLKPSPDGAKHE